MNDLGEVGVFWNTGGEGKSLKLDEISILAKQTEVAWWVAAK
ncbi:hypothetical protein [Burkholderia ubonensis]|nr:hypothetical protein [Burkholderia ubonensis]